MAAVVELSRERERRRTIQPRPTPERTPVHTEPQFSLSMLMLVDGLRPYVAACPYEFFQIAASQLRPINNSERRTLDYWPFWFTRYQTRTGSRDLDFSSVATATSSYRAEKHLWHSLTHPNKGLAVRSFFLLPHRDNLRAVARVANQTFPRVPVSAYLETGDINISSEDIRNRVFQPTKELIDKLKLEDSAALRRFCERGGWGLNIDTTTCRHLWKDGKLEDVIGLVKRVDLSPERSDFKEAAEMTKDDLLIGSEFFQMFQALVDLGFKGPYNIKVPLSTAEKIVGCKDRAFGPRKMGRVYLRLAIRLKEGLK